MTYSLIQVIVHDDEMAEDGTVIRSGGAEEVHLGPATPEQIAASIASSPYGFIQIDDDGDVVPPGGFAGSTLRTVYVDIDIDDVTTITDYADTHSIDARGIAALIHSDGDVEPVAPDPDEQTITMLDGVMQDGLYLVVELDRVTRVLRD